MNSNTLQFINQLIILMMFLNERFGQIPFHFVIIMRHYFYFMCVCVNTQHACHDIWVQVQGQPLVSTSALFRWDRVSLVVSPCMYKTSWPTSPRNFPLGGASVVTQIKGYNARLAGVCYIGGFLWVLEDSNIAPHSCSANTLPSEPSPQPSAPLPVYGLFLQWCTGPPGLCESSQWAWSQGLFVPWDKHTERHVNPGDELIGWFLQWK